MEARLQIAYHLFVSLLLRTPNAREEMSEKSRIDMKPDHVMYIV